MASGDSSARAGRRSREQGFVPARGAHRMNERVTRASEAGLTPVLRSAPLVEGSGSPGLGARAGALNRFLQ